MLPRLGIQDLAQYSQELGLDLTPAEMQSRHARMLEHLATFETFQELRIEEQRLPFRYTDRDPGYRPTVAEDPLNVFIRKCRIEGAKDGPLAGKTIGLRDHISVAGADGYDPRQTALPVRLPSDTQAVARDIEGVRIGILSEGFGFPGSEPEVDQTVLNALTTLEQAGAQLERVSVPLHDKAPLALLPIYFEGGKHMFDTNLAGAGTKTYYPSSFISTFPRGPGAQGRGGLSAFGRLG